MQAMYILIVVFTYVNPVMNVPSIYDTIDGAHSATMSIAETAVAAIIPLLALKVSSAVIFLLDSHTALKKTPHEETIATCNHFKTLSIIGKVAIV